VVAHDRKQQKFRTSARTPASKPLMQKFKLPSRVVMTQTFALFRFKFLHNSLRTFFSALLWTLILIVVRLEVDLNGRVADSFILANAISFVHTSNPRVQDPIRLPTITASMLQRRSGMASTCGSEPPSNPCFTNSADDR
ncbi:MAG: hypothetical protein O3A47_13175, partial [Chloroflexi bacterium]|nr:hypothetical protein [Chloroflexota bacterium]